MFLTKLKNKPKQHKSKSQNCKKIPAKMFLWKLCEHSQLVQNSCLLENKASGLSCSQHFSTGIAWLSQAGIYLMHMLKYSHAMKSQDTWGTGHSLFKKINVVKL